MQTAQDPAGRFLARLKDLRGERMPYPEAHERAWLEDKIRAWADTPGDELVFWLYGGIQVDSDIDLPDVGVHVSSQRKTANFVFKAQSAYECRVRVRSKDLPVVLDAVERLETFLSAWCVTGRGATIQYFCSLLFSGGEVFSWPPDQLTGIKHFLSALNRRRGRQRDLILRAAWWVRQSHESLSTGKWNPSMFSMYAAYWNALECLTEAICDAVPPKKLSKVEKTQGVSRFFRDLGRIPGPADVDECYRLYVDPGFRQRARHALRQAFGVVGEQYYKECFEKKPETERLYQIRNDINHANIVEFKLDDRLRVGNGLVRLRLIVLNLLSLLTDQGLVLDSAVQACHTCAHLDETQSCRLSLLPAATAYWRYVCDQYAAQQGES
jgi:hypothetical protein